MAKRKKPPWDSVEHRDGTMLRTDGNGAWIWIGTCSHLPTVLHTAKLARRICRAVNKVEGRGGAKHGKA